MNVTLRDGSTVTLSPKEIAALRIVRRTATVGGTLTSTALDLSIRRTLNSLAKRDIINVGHADENDARARCYSINDWRVSEAVAE